MPWRNLDTVKQRTEFVRRSYDPSVVFVELCREYGISTKTGYKWRKRFEEGGLCGLEDQSRRPRRHADELQESVICEMLRIKMAHPHWGPRKIREVYRRSHGKPPSESSFKRVLERAGLVNKRKRRPTRSGERISYRIKPEAPNDLWTVDFKGWWNINPKQRCEPLTIRDEYSRFILEVRAMKTSKTDPVRKAFEEVFHQYGLPKYIRSDNGSPFAGARSPLGLSALSVWWVTLGIGLDRIQPGRPQQNGSHERMHLDIRRELQGLIEGDLADHQAAFNVWRDEFNRERPHEALGMNTPEEIYKHSERRYEPGGYELVYPSSMITRRISPAGVLCIESQQIFLSECLRGTAVGLRPLPERRYEVWLDYINLGILDVTTATMEWGALPTPSSP